MVAQDGRFGHFLPSGWHPHSIVGTNNWLCTFPSLPALSKQPKNDGRRWTNLYRQHQCALHLRPSKADNDHLGEMANIAMGQSAERLLREKVTRAALYGLRNQINLFNSNELMRGQIYTQLEKGCAAIYYAPLPAWAS